ncbi:MAG: toxin TcdB middle/N-terminal domain-containing protein [Verrucomicrobiota bacterium]
MLNDYISSILSRPFCVIVFAAFCLPWANLTGQSVLVGKLPGDVSVNNTGQATYTLPFELPEGVAGLTPELSLDYSSGNGYGVLGLGWSLGGHGAITRGGSIYALDGVVDGVDFDSGDNFLMEGSRLMHVGGSAHYSDGAIYRPLIDDFTQVTAKGSSNGPTHFIAQTKSGLTKYYGLGGNSGLIFNNRADDARTSWMLSKVEDTTGNSIDYSYIYDSETNELLLDKIEYGDVSAPIEVQFNYEVVNQRYSSFLAGAQLLVLRRLDSFSISISGTKLWEYDLDYDLSPISKKSRIVSVKKSYFYEGSIKSLPPTSFSYRDYIPTTVWTDAGSEFIPTVSPLIDDDLGNPDYGPNSTPGLSSRDEHDDLGLRWVDLDGDGLQDILYGNDLYGGERAAFINEGSGQGFVYNAKFNPPERIARGTKDDKDYGVRLIDVNGDGLPDFVRSYIDDGTGNLESKAYLNQFDPDSSATSYWVEDSGYALPKAIVDDDFEDAGLRFVDLDGDGRVDFLKAFGSGTAVAYINTGSGWAEGSTLGFNFAPPLSIVDGSSDDVGFRLVDLNGDGLSDIVRSDDTGDRRAYLNTGTAWEEHIGYRIDTQIALSPASGGSTPPTSAGGNTQISFIDLNGDGLIDWSKHDGTYLNTGDGWTSEPFFDAPANFADGRSRMVDLNGDGLVDVSFSVDDASGNLSSKAYILSHDGWSEDNTLAVAYPYADYVSVIDPVDPLDGHLVDLDGDGILDQVSIFKNDYVGAKINNYTRPDLLETVTDGMGVVTTISYAPITDDSVYEKEQDIGDTDSVETDATFPIVEFRAPMWVVKTVETEDGVGGTYSTTYRYAGARMHLQGFGFLGFRVFTSEDLETGLVKCDILAQAHPFTGMKYGSKTYGPNGQILSYTKNVLASKGLNLNAQSEAQTLFPYFWSSEEWKAEYDAVTVFDNYTEQALIDEIVGTNGHYGHTLTKNTMLDEQGVETGAFDEYGNLLRLYIVFGDDYTQETVNQYYTVDTIKWYLGRLANSTVTSEAPNNTSQNETVIRESSFTYDLSGTGLLISETVEPNDPSLKITTTYQRDTQGRVISTTLSPVDIAPDTITTSSSSVLDATKRFYGKTTNALGHSETVVHDSLRGWVDSQTGPNGRTTYFQYDAMGRPIREDRPDGTWATTSYEWINVDRSEQLLFAHPETTGINLYAVYKVTTASSEAPSSTSWYDSLGRVVRSSAESYDGTLVYQDIGFNHEGQADCMSENYFSGERSSALWTKTSFDDLGRPTIAVAPDQTEMKTIYNGRETTVIKNYLGTETVHTSANDQTMKTLLNARGDKVRETSYTSDGVGSPEELTIDYHYDGVGNLLETVTTDSDNNTRIISMTYDIRGNKTGMVDPDMGNWSYTYNALDQLITQTDAELQVTKKDYDELGRVTVEYYGYVDDSTYDSKYEFFYDGIGQFQQIGKLHLEKSSSGFRRSHYYDDMGRNFVTLTKIKNRWFYVQTDYDAFSRPIRLTHYWRPPSLDDGTHDNYLTWYSYTQESSYNPRGFVSEVKDGNGQVWFSLPDYNEHGQLESYLSGGVVRTNSIYDNATHLIEQITVEELDGTDLLDQTFDFDPLGNLIERTKQTGTGTRLTEEFFYDDLNRLEEAAVSGGDTLILEYDDFGNITSRTNSAGSSALGHVGTYGYVLGKNQVTSAGGRSFLYDDNGSIEQVTGGGKFTDIAWTAFNKPLSLTANNSKRSLFSYDTVNSRVSQTRETYDTGSSSWETESRKTYVGSLFEQEQSWPGMGSASSADEDDPSKWDITSTRIYIATPAGVVGSWIDDVSQTSPTKTVFHKDHLGSVVAETDISVSPPTLDKEFSYDAWGLARNSVDWVGAPSATPNREATDRGYTGHEMLDELGLVHMNGRIYDPLLGRMLSADPFVQQPSNFQNYNRYAYVANNPLSSTDPSGFFIKNLMRAIGKFLVDNWRTIVTIAIAAVVFVALPAAWAPILKGAIAGGLSGAAGAALTGGNIFEGALFGALSGAVAAGIGDYFNTNFYADGVATYDDPFIELARATSHGVSQGGIAELQGGDFGSTFLSAFSGSLAGSMIQANSGADSFLGAADQKGKYLVRRTVAAAVVGGTAAELGGGKFANGAVTAAMVHLFNHETINYRRKIKSGRDAEKAEAERQRKLGRRVVSKKVSARYDGDGYITGREYDVVAIDEAGHYNLIEVKYRNPRFRARAKGKGGLILNLIEAGVAGVALRQVDFDFGAMITDELTLRGKGLPGGEITLDPDQYTIHWAVVKPNGRGQSFELSPKSFDAIGDALFE